MAVTFLSIILLLYYSLGTLTLFILTRHRCIDGIGVV